jgi:hypothetical protein
MMISTQLNTLNLSDVVDYVIKGCFLLIETKAKYPAMVNELVKFNFNNEEEAGDGIVMLHNMVKAYNEKMLK